jgi:hypothetical protein
MVGYGFFYDLSWFKAEFTGRVVGLSDIMLRMV